MPSCCKQASLFLSLHTYLQQLLLCATVYPRCRLHEEHPQLLPVITGNLGAQTASCTPPPAVRVAGTSGLVILLMSGQIC
jgi:hypothetical protein